MNKIKPILVNNDYYVNAATLCALFPKNTNLSKSSHYIVKQLKLVCNTDFIYVRLVNNLWTLSSGSSNKYDKVFINMLAIQKHDILSQHVDLSSINPVLDNKLCVNNNKKKDVVNKIPIIQLDDVNKKNSDDDKINNPIIIEKHPIIQLNDNEKFVDNNGTVFDIETRGVRKIDSIFFKVKDVGFYFGFKELRKNINKDTSSYKHPEDYIYLHTDYSPKVMFFTYTGLLRCLFVSRSKNVSNFHNWCVKTLFAAQFGTEKQKNKLVANVKGISYDIIHDLFSKNARSLPCIYLTLLNTVKNLRTVMNIDCKYNDTDLVYKFGLTKDFDNRTDGHKNTFKDIADHLDLNLVLYTYIDPLNLRQAETELAQFITDIKFEYKNHQEIIIVSQSYFKNIKNFFEKIGFKYSGHTAQFNQQINELNNDISKLQNIVDQKNDSIDNLIKYHQLELDNKNLEISKNEEIYKAKLESMSFQLQYKDLLLQQK